MQDVPSLKTLAQAVGTAAAFYMSGYHYASDRLALPGVLLTKDPRTQLRQWFLGWDVGRVIGPALVHVVAGCFAYAAWAERRDTPQDPLRFGLDVLAAVSAGAVGPYTLVKVFPINDVLLAERGKVLEGDKKGEMVVMMMMDAEGVRGNVEVWRKADRVRAVMMHVAAVAGLLSLAMGKDERA